MRLVMVVMVVMVVIVVIVVVMVVMMAEVVLALELSGLERPLRTSQLRREIAKAHCKARSLPERARF
jgi:uncharacterized membrane protein